MKLSLYLNSVFFLISTGMAAGGGLRRKLEDLGLESPRGDGMIDNPFYGKSPGKEEMTMVKGRIREVDCLVAGDDLSSLPGVKTISSEELAKMDLPQVWITKGAK